MKRARSRRVMRNLALITIFAVLRNVQSQRNPFYDTLHPRFKFNTTGSSVTSPSPKQNISSSIRDSSVNTSTASTITVKRQQKTSTETNRLVSKICKGLPTSRLKSACWRVARDSYIVKMQKHILVSERALNLNPFPKTPSGDYNCVLTCPTKNDWFNAKTESGRSLSPWGHCLNHDPNRIPRWMNKAHCLCMGCINPITGEHSLDHVSTPIKTRVPVVRKEPFIASFDKCDNKACFESREEVTIGCHCMNPKKVES